MKTFEELEKIMLDKLPDFDAYDWHTKISRDQLSKYIKLFYLLGKMKGIQFGSSYMVGSDNLEKEFLKIESVFNYIENDKI